MALRLMALLLIWGNQVVLFLRLGVFTMVLDWSINLMGFPRVQVESDSTLIMSWIKDGLD